MLCKYINYLKITGYMWKSYESLTYNFSDIMTVHFNVFGPFMVNLIGSNLIALLLSARIEVGLN